MNNLNSKEMIQDAVKEVEKFVPKHSHVEIDVKEDPIGVYSTGIRVHTKEKTYFAKKEDMFLYRSFSKAIRALKAQFIKRKVQHESLRTRNIYT